MCLDILARLTLLLLLLISTMETNLTGLSSLMPWETAEERDESCPPSTVRQNRDVNVSRTISVVGMSSMPEPNQNWRE